jgi:hypothetical protein
MQNEHRLVDRTRRLGSLKARGTIQPASPANLAGGISAPSYEPMLPDWAHRYLDRANKEEAAERAPKCPHCVGGITDQDDICTYCAGEGRILK